MTASGPEPQNVTAQAAFTVIPVIDLKDGVVVRGRGGRRLEYQPIVSPLVAAPNPVELAHVFYHRFGCKNLYLADLNAIIGGRPNTTVLQHLAQIGLTVWVDAGVRMRGDAHALLEAGASVVIAGLETLASPAELGGLIHDYGPTRICFSLDLRAGRPLGASTWSNDIALIVEAVSAMGVTQLLVLDLADVGSHAGSTSTHLCQAICQRYPHLNVGVGGGMRNVSDLHTARSAGASSALVASALHDGGITAADLRTFGA